MSDPTLGSIFPRTDAYPKPAQPGGPGTPVTNMPQSSPVPTGVPDIVAGAPQIPVALWTAGCSHWFNNWDVREAGVGGVPSAFLCCPLCSYIQRIITPHRLIYTDPYFILQA